MISQMIVGGLGGQGFGAFILPLQREFGWSKGMISVARSLMQVENGLLGPIEGFFVDKLGPRVMVVSGLAIFGGGMVLLSFVHSLWMYFTALVLLPWDLVSVASYLHQRLLTFGLSASVPWPSHLPRPARD